MKITNIEALPIWAGNRNYFFVVVDTDEGISGVGESGLAGRELAVSGAIEHLKPLLIGINPSRIEHIWQLLYRGGFFPANKVITSAMSAIDVALWDIQGKVLGVPVYQLLGGLVRDKVVCYPHNTYVDFDIESLVESCHKTTAEGWKFVRWGLPQEEQGILEPRRSVRMALEQFRAVRQAAGEEIDICFDIHTRLDPADTIWLCREAEEFHPFFMEDPVRSESTQALRQVRTHTSVPIAAGEQFASKWDFRQPIEEDLIDYARIDVCIVGGITEAKKIAGWCETHYIKLALHNPLGPVAAAASLHLDLACNNFGVQEQPRRPGTSLTDVFPVQVPWEDGYLLPPQRPGLGIVFDREAAKKYPFQMRELQHLHRRDGSLTNW